MAIRYGQAAKLLANIGKEKGLQKVLDSLERVSEPLKVGKPINNTKTIPSVENASWISRDLLHGSPRPWESNALRPVDWGPVPNTAVVRAQMGRGIYTTEDWGTARSYASEHTLPFDQRDHVDPHIYHLRTKVEPQMLDMDKPLSSNTASIFARHINPEKWMHSDSPTVENITKMSGAEVFRRGRLHWNPLAEKNLTADLKNLGYHGMSWSETTHGWTDHTGKLHTSKDYSSLVHKFFDPLELEVVKVEKGFGNAPHAEVIAKAAKRIPRRGIAAGAVGIGALAYGIHHHLSSARHGAPTQTRSGRGGIAYLG